MADDHRQGDVSDVQHSAQGDARANALAELRVALESLKAASCSLENEGIRQELRRLGPKFEAALPRGTSVIIELRSFELVHAMSRAAALKAFIARYGRDASGWAIDVGQPVSLGGGVCTS